MEATFTKLLLLTVLAAGSGIPMEGSQEMPAQSEIDDNEAIGLPDAENGTSNTEGAESSPTDAVDLAEVIHDQQVQLDYLYDLFHSRFTNDKQNSTPIQTALSEAEMMDQVKTSESSSGGVYIRWGRDVCPSSADQVYSGLAAGAERAATGGGANYLCLPESPVYDRPQNGVQDRTSRLYGVEYRFDFPPIQSLVEHDVPCAVCESIGRSTVLMVPARPSCPSGWTREYYGFLMAERSTHQRTQYVCLDGHPTYRSGTAAASNDFATMQPVEGICSGTGGGLPCGPYVNGYELTCAVCTK
ncbi:short-chain collagen C4-like [Apostichopus japonicus]|uniref:short-chain collagen C4-like n=1 Tax=Stichopus japonicus TaxID=307972 RepID=UPI003AB1D074